MSTNTMANTDTANITATRAHSESTETTQSTVQEFVTAFASLKFTVWLFALTIFLVVAGTLAQVDKEIWQVVDEYFRCFIAWIDFQLFLPPSFFPDRPQVRGGFYFPGGWTLGILLGLNLVAAHSVRFKAQARGRRLASGLAIIAFGLLITWLVIVSGANGDGLQAVPIVSWSTMWNLTLVSLGVISSGLVAVGWRTSADRVQLRRLVISTGLAGLVLLAWIVLQGESARLNDSSLRILWQLAKGTAAGIVLLAGCVLVFGKRAGIVLLHGGVGLLMFSELMVGLTAVEAKMSISEGQTVNYTENLRQLELAIVTPQAEQDEVISVPQSMLEPGKVIRHEYLPFDIRVEAYMKNAEIRRAAPNLPNPATEGLGLEWTAHQTPQVSGTDMSGRINESAAYVTFLDKQSAEPLGTHLVSLQQSALDLPEKVTVDDVPHKVYLRFERHYKPYSISLLDVRKDDYLGTDTPRNYSSDIRLVDESRGVDREVHIWMNNPLRFAGETFYQSGYHRDSQSGIESTTLQVVTNTGWMIPYVACMLVATGMLAHFSIVLLRFLQRRERGLIGNVEAADAPADGTTVAGDGGSRERESWSRRLSRSWKTWIVPVCVVLVLGGWVAGKARVPSPSTGEMDLYAFGKTPVVYQGRSKPIDTLARNTLRILSGRQTFIDDDGDRQPAIRWLLDVMVRPEVALKHKVFRIENPEVLQTLGLEPREGFRYSFAEVQDTIGDLAKQAELARSQDSDQLSTYQKKILEAERKFGLFELLVRSFRKPSVRVGTENEALDMRIAAQQQQMLMQRTPPLIVPPKTEDDKWTTYSSASLEAMRRGASQESESDTPLAMLDKIRDAYAEGEAREFNAAVAAYRSAIGEDVAANVDLGKIDFEAFFNHFEPFYHSAVLYVAAFLLTAVSWLGFSRPLNRSAFWLIVFTFVIHSLALVGRIYISGRPPVTNLYSSAVFIGWGCVLLGILLERMYRIGTGNVIAAIAGFSTLLIAHFLAGDGDTFAVLQAVLDTQFWLATHVVCITLGYATTYVAGLLGILYVVRGVLTPTLSTERGKDLIRMIYGTLCFALFFSFVGTVLGGLWADDSWGRFWGWDPKENGALIIVLWNALVLHARWGNIVKDRGFAVLAVAGNIAVSWSWFGVNELGVGLHSYGFTEGVLLALGLFVLSQLAIIAIGSLPQNWWWSVRRQASTG